MKNTTTEKKYFYGNEISKYGLENGYVDYRTLAKCFDAVLANDLISNTWETGYWEQENGFCDYSDELEEINEQIEELEASASELLEEENDNEDSELEAIREQIDDLEERKLDLEEMENYPPEIYQYYIIDHAGAELLKRETNEVIFYNEVLDLYVWGVCHFGTAWDYVLTDIKIDW